MLFFFIPGKNCSEFFPNNTLLTDGVILEGDSSLNVTCAQFYAVKGYGTKLPGYTVYCDTLGTLQGEQTCSCKTSVKPFNDNYLSLNGNVNSYVTHHPYSFNYHDYRTCYVLLIFNKQHYLYSILAPG